MDLKPLKENPELFRLCLRNIIHELAACFNESNMSEKESRFIKLFLQDNFKATLQHRIDSMWNEFNITEKMTVLNQMEKEAPPDFVAWRPTGEVPVTILRGYFLSNYKERLLKKIENTKKKKAFLSESLLSSVQDRDKCVETICQNEKVLLGIFKEYQEIIEHE
ncbi:hypothetical protein PPYR_04554 [Photinus pyralis]|uniref:Uncharacterized protein n=1 Tax=Photinus pyralis TaxID=7054 RepID=A0A1Y1L2A4_PHOPY|nr:uncharacterized protein LOC116162700 [Photinus pyralis]XP_031332271.1 uncharacterized protein LOC116162722 [Photinus pyralis]KAB0802306.1 hypothetical protein PPYR_04492 [Photinus pyralis]KAB0802368.1 hypothetical protein PPYR_04554 [Photinus pyralis]